MRKEKKFIPKNESELDEIENKTRLLFSNLNYSFNMETDDRDSGIGAAVYQSEVWLHTFPGNSIVFK